MTPLTDSDDALPATRYPTRSSRRLNSLGKPRTRNARRHTSEQLWGTPWPIQSKQSRGTIAQTPDDSLGRAPHSGPTSEGTLGPDEGTVAGPIEKARRKPSTPGLNESPQAHTVKFVIIKTRQPRIRKKELGIQSIAGKTAEAVYEDIGKEVEWGFENLTFRLKTFDEEYEVVIGRGEEARFAKMQVTFAKKIRADMKHTQNRDFTVEIEPDMVNATKPSAEEDSDEMDWSSYI